MDNRMFRVRIVSLGWMMSAISLFAPVASAVCPSGDLLPDLRALPARDVAVVLGAQGQPTGQMKFTTTSWNSGGERLELITKELDTGASKRRVDQRIYCNDGTYYEHSAGFFEYHAAHNHVHFNDYANYILEPLDANPQNIRKGTKTTFCIIDTTNINTQLLRAASSPVYSACATQVYGSKQGMSVGWGDTYGSYLEGQSIYTGDLPPGLYRLRIVIDPKDQLLEISNDNNESCKLVEIGFGLDGSQYVADKGLCVDPPPTPQLYAINPTSLSQGTCSMVTITGDNLVPETRMSFLYGTGPLPAARNVEFPDAATVKATVCVPKSPGKKPRLGSNPVWDLFSGNPTLPHVGSATLEDAFRVNP
ncbi:MAG: lysyl oxidase family protein [Gammaproteobacteria bacterium]